MVNRPRRKIDFGVQDGRNDRSAAVPPFVIGFCVALLVICVSTISLHFLACKDFDVGLPESCPAILVASPPKKKVWWKALFDDQNKPAFLVLKPDPLECVCRFFSISRITRNAQNSVSPFCKPEILDEELLDSRKAPSQISAVKFKTAFTSEYLHLNIDQKKLVESLGERVERNIIDWRDRVSMVRWGGPSGPDWFDSAKTAAKTDLESLDGGQLYYSYLRIMKWPTLLRSNFPFNLCGKGCDSEIALNHTLEFREKFQPWLVSPSTIKENSNGCIFHHGFSPSLSPDENGAHSLVWIRPGKRVKAGDIFSTRAYVNVLEQAVTSSLTNSNGRVGKFNVVVDGDNFSWGLMPSMHQLKVFIVILQDHFPDRLGNIVLTNLGRIGELVVGIVKPLISEEVRQKITILPRDAIQRSQVLETIIGIENIPHWLGGKAKYEFDPTKYYSDDTIVSDEICTEYVKTMPYHS